MLAPPPPDNSAPKHYQTESLKTPPSWSPSATHFDTSLVGHLPLPRTIEATSWSRSRGLAGMPIFDVRVHQLAYRGVQEWNLRNIAAGRFTGVVFTRSIPETIFLAKLSHGLRDNGVDLDKVSHVVWTQNNQQPPKKQDDPGAYVAPLAQRIVDVLKPLMPVEQDLYALHQMQALQSDNEKYRKKLAESGIPITPEKRKAENPVNNTHAQKKMKFEELPVTYDELQQAASVVPRVSQMQATNAKVIKEFQQNAESQLHDGVLSMKLKEYITKVFNSIGGGDKKTKQKVVDLAVRWGLPAQIAMKAPCKTLTHIIAVAAFMKHAGL